MIYLNIISESGYLEALYGIGLSYGKTSDINFNQFYPSYNDMDIVAVRLSQKDTGENKFLEHIYIWLLVTAPRHWWQEADTYRLSSKQSESTMHTLMKKPITQDMFSSNIPNTYLGYLEGLRADGQEFLLRDSLPEGFLQTREWVMSYKELRHIYKQRKNHRKQEWKDFCSFIKQYCSYPSFLGD